MLPRFTLACLLIGLAPPALAQTPAPHGVFLTALPDGGSRVSEIIGTRVIGSDIRHLGEVKDIVLDRDGHAAAVVIASGGLLGTGEKTVAVPYRGLLWDYDVSPTDGPSSRTTGGDAAAGRAVEAKRADATSPGPENLEATGTVGDPQQPGEGLRPQGATVPVTGRGKPTAVVLRMTLDELRNAPAFQIP